VINKIDLAPSVGADLAVMERDAKRMRGDGLACSRTSKMEPVCLRSSIGYAPTFDVSTEDDFVIEKPTTINNPAI